jgi:hypothetical protein
MADIKDCPSWVDELVQQLVNSEVDLDVDFVIKKERKQPGQAKIGPKHISQDAWL